LEGSHGVINPPRMDFAFSDEQEQFRETLRRFLQEKSPVAQARALLATPDGYDHTVWKQMAGDLGLLGLHIPESAGGQGFGFLELGIVFEEMGRVLYGGPYFSTVALAANAILNAASPEQQSRWLGGIASGDSIATLAFLEPGGGWDPASIALVAHPEKDGRFSLHGTKPLVTDGSQADLILVAARLEGTHALDGITLLALCSQTAGVKATPIAALDPTRRLARLDFDDARAESIGEPGCAGEALQSALDQAAVLLALENTGGTDQCLQMAVEYSKMRMQFGRPVGSFQAIKHKCADLLLEVENARSASYWSSWVASDDPAQLAQAASVAKSLSSDAYCQAAADNIQIHGGIGTTWEADPQLYFKRARSNYELLGSPVFYRKRIMRGFGI